MARIPAFQAGCVGSIPITRSKKDDYVVIVFLVIFALRQLKTDCVGRWLAAAVRLLLYMVIYAESNYKSAKVGSDSEPS